MKDAELIRRVEYFVAAVESCRLYPYVDTAGKITIGWGYNLTDRGITQTLANLWREEDIRESIRSCRTLYPWFDGLDPVRKAVLIDMTYNMGAAKLATFKRMLTAMEKKQWKTAAMHAMASTWFIQTKRRAWWIVRMIAWGQWPDLSREPTKPKPADLA